MCEDDAVELMAILYERGNRLYAEVSNAQITAWVSETEMDTAAYVHALRHAAAQGWIEQRTEMDG